MDAGADQVLQPDGEGGQPLPLLQQAELEVEGAVGRGAAARGAVQPVREAEGRLQEGQGLEIHEPEVPLMAERDAGLQRAVRAEAGVAHLQQPDAAVIAARGRNRGVLGARGGGEAEGEEEGGEAAAPRPPGRQPHYRPLDRTITASAAEDSATCASTCVTSRRKPQVS